MPTQGKIFSVACYHTATGIPQPRPIQHELDYSDSLLSCSDTGSWVWSVGHLVISGPLIGICDPSSKGIGSSKHFSRSGFGHGSGRQQQTTRDFRTLGCCCLCSSSYVCIALISKSFSQASPPPIGAPHISPFFASSVMNPSHHSFRVPCLSSCVFKSCLCIQRSTSSNVVETMANTGA